MVEFYLLTFLRFPLRKKEHKSCFGKNRTHDFRTSRCADYLLDHSGDCMYVCMYVCMNVYLFKCMYVFMYVWSSLIAEQELAR